MILVVFTMIFRYPLIPYFLVVRSYGLLNSLWSQMLTHLMVAFNLVVLRTFFMQLPTELDESATIEGANHLQILVRITLPLSMAALATVGLFYAVLYWNLYLHPMLFLQDSRLYPLQLRLRMMLQTVDEAASNMQARTDFSPTTVRSAAIIFATVPILLLYPFLQKHFAKGAMIGSLKG
jgi:putative aldouronate transport system permease protein